MYPVFLDVKEKKCLVVGGGDVAARKAAGLLAAFARVIAVSPHFGSSFAELTGNPLLQLVKRPFCDGDITGSLLVFAATDNSQVNCHVAELCEQAGIFCNIADLPAAGSFIVPSVIRQGPLIIAVSTGGYAPAAAKQIRESLQGEFDDAYAVVLSTLGEARTKILSDVSDSMLRRKMLTALQFDELLSIYRREGSKGIEEKINEILDSNR